MFAARHHLSLILVATLLAGASSAAFAAQDKVSYDFAMSQCFGAMIIQDPEMQQKMYDGAGFVWNAQRDQEASSCMSHYGYQMPGEYTSRVGGAGAVGPENNPQAIRDNFRAQMLQYGGESALAQIDSGSDMTFVPQAKTEALRRLVRSGGGGRTSGAAPKTVAPMAPVSQNPVAPSINLPTAPAPQSPSVPSPTAPTVSAPSAPTASAPSVPPPATPTGGSKPIFLPH